MSVPDYIESALVAYRDLHRIPGGFTQAVLSNDLLRAEMTIHPGIRHRLADITAWCWGNLPGDIWGTPDRVAAHLAHESVPDLDAEDF